MKTEAKNLELLYLNTLLKDVLPFWQKYSIDKRNGGYFTCLDRFGNVYDTDKFIWLQARQVWTFSMLYNRLEKRDDWLDVARHRASFLAKHGSDEDGNWYFALDQRGKPLIQPYNIFSDCFAAMAFSQYAQASGDEKARDLALRTYRNVLRRKDHPKGKYSKVVPDTRPLCSLAIPMILANLTMEMRCLLEAHSLNETIDTCLSEIMDLFLDPQSNLVFEHVSPDGEHPDCFDGRLINPGHSIEAMWFVMDCARSRNDQKLIQRAVDVILSVLDFSWDSEYAGIYYFLDAKGHPTQQLEWSLKLWWVHLEALVALSMGYYLTGREECWLWFEKIHQYAWSQFADPEYGEWFGYLNRDGKKLYDLKGGKWKGCFHLPRALYLCHRTWSELVKQDP